MSFVREEATVASVFFGKEEHDLLTVQINLNIKGRPGIISGTFGNLVFGEDRAMARDFIKCVCELFDVDDLNNCRGKECFILRCWDVRDGEIEGLECDGRRMTLTAWRRKHDPTTLEPIDRQRHSLNEEISRGIAAVVSAAAKMRDAHHGYVNWERVPIGKAGEK